MSTEFEYSIKAGIRRKLALRYAQSRPDDSATTCIKMAITRQEFGQLPPLTTVYRDSTDMRETLAMWISEILLAPTSLVAWPEDLPDVDVFTPPVTLDDKSRNMRKLVDRMTMGRPIMPHSVQSDERYTRHELHMANIDIWSAKQDRTDLEVYLNNFRDIYTDDHIELIERAINLLKFIIENSEEMK